MSEQYEVSSTRVDGDSWDITEGVGATALSVAACRAAETRQPQPLIRDEYAQVLVSTAGAAWARLAGGDLDWLDDDDEYGRRVVELGRNYQAVRTHFFDAYLQDAAAAGIRQAVILAAGLDARAYRLRWPAGSTVYEIDQPKVLAYKAATLDGSGAVAASTRRAVAVDLRDDWPAALLAAGFDRSAPTAWLAEGLLPYLPAAAQDRLFDNLTALSAPGSRIAVEAFGPFTPDHRRRRTASRERRARIRQRLGLDVDIEALVYHEEGRAEAADLLTRHGWRIEAVDSTVESARLGRPVPEDLADQTAGTTLLTGRR